MFDFNKPVRMQKQIIALNASAAILNLGLMTMHLMNGKWIFIANLIAGVFSAWVTWGCWKKLPEIIAREKQKVIDILRGEYDNYHCIDG